MKTEFTEKMKMEVYKNNTLPKLHDVRSRCARIEFIFTFKYAPQQIASYPFVKPILKDQNTLLDFATAELTDKEVGSLVKMSCCIYSNKRFKTPEWWDNSKGKFYDDDLRPYKAANKIENTVTPIN